MLNLTDFIHILGGGTPKTSIPSYWNGDIPWISITDLDNNSRWIKTTEKSITIEGLNNSSTRLLDAGDIVISARGTVGTLAQLKIPMAFNQSCYGIKAKESLVTQDYLYYLLKKYIHILKKNTHGSVFETITIDTFSNIQLPLPPLSEQKRTANILSSFDNKIEILKKENKILEDIAENIFKEWFVKYNFPNKDRKPYKDSGGKMIDSELGLIPEGWRVGKLGDYINIKGGGTPSTKEPSYWNGELNWTTPKDLSNLQGIFLFESQIKITELGLKKVSSGLLPSKTLLLSSRAPIGYLAFTEVQTAINQGFIAFLPNFYMPNTYMYLWLKQNIKLVESIANGSTFLEVSKESLREFHTIIPPKELLDIFDLKISSLFERISINEQEIEHLKEIKTALLNKLITA